MGITLPNSANARLLSSTTLIRRSVGGAIPAGFTVNGFTAPWGALFAEGQYRANGASSTLANALTHTRASTATYVDSSGTLQTAASGELRVGHHVWNVDANALGYDLTPDYWIDATNGSNANAGTSEGAAWATVGKIRDLYAVSKAGSVVVRVKTGTYNSADDYVEITSSDAPVNDGLIIVFESGCIMDGTTAVASTNRNGFEFSTPEWTTTVFGNGLTVRNYDNSFGSSNGLGNRGDHTLIARGVTVDNCSDGVSGHGDSFIEVYDCTFQNCEKAAYAHVDNATTSHTRCVFTAKSGATLGVGANQSSLTATFTDCKFIPAASGDNIDLSKGTLTRCRVGTTSARVSNNGSGAVFTDCFVNMSMDAGRGATLSRCFGRFSARNRFSTTLTMQNCVFYSPASGQSSAFFSNFDFGGGPQHIIEDCIFWIGGAASFFMDYDATNAGYIVADASRWHNNILFGAAAFDADLIAADTGGTVIVDNLSTDPLVPGLATFDPEDYAYATGSPAIGAGTDGGNIGFAEGEVAPPEELRATAGWVNKGALVEDQKTNLLLNSATLSTQNVTVTAEAHTLHFTGTGTVTLSGAATAGPLVGTGTGENNRVSLSFTPTAGTLTLTVSGTVSNAQLETGVQTSYIPTTGSQVTRAADVLTADAAKLPWSGTAVSLVIEGEMTYADNNETFILLDWFESQGNWARLGIDTNGTRTGAAIFFQANDLVYDIAIGAGTQFSPGYMRRVALAGTFSSNELSGAANGVSVTPNTTPLALADLSSTNLQIAEDFNGTISRVLVFAEDITEAGREDATS